MTANNTISTTRQAIRNSITAQMMGTILPTLLRQGGLTSLMIIALVGQDSELEIGVALGIMQWSMVARLPASPRVDVTWRRSFLVRWTAISACTSLLLPLVLLAGIRAQPPWTVWALLGALALFFATMQIGATAWFPLLHAILPPSLRGRYFGNMRRAWQVTGAIAVFASGAFLGREPGIGRFFIILLPAIALQFGRVFMYARLPNPAPARASGNTRLWHSMLAPLRDARFRHFITFILLTAMAQHAAMPFVVPFLKARQGFPASLTLYCTGCLGLGSILSLRPWGRLADRWGTRLVFLLSCTLAVGGFILIAMVPSYPSNTVLAGSLAVCSLILAGVGTAGIDIAYTVRLMRLAPAQSLGPYLNMTQAALGLSTGLTAMLAGLALNQLPPKLVFAGRTIVTFRLFFAGIAALLLFMLTRVRRLPKIGEPGMRHAAGAAMARIQETCGRLWG